MFGPQDHMFALCAYQESPYLEDCLRSLLEQAERDRIVISTSTPNAHIAEVARRYDVRLVEHEGPSGIARDWTRAIFCCDTPLVTIAHQDDIYLSAYRETMLACLNEEERPLIGTYKALGYRNREIYAKYLVYAVAASLTGCAVGLFLGFIALPAFMFVIFGIMYLLLFAYSTLAMIASREAFEVITVGERIAMLFFSPFYLLEYLPIFIQSRVRAKKHCRLAWEQSERQHYESAADEAEKASETLEKPDGENDEKKSA